MSHLPLTVSNPPPPRGVPSFQILSLKLPQVWHNIAYGIDFTGGSVSFYHSTGGDPLKLTAGPIAASGASSVGGFLALSSATDHQH